MLGSRFLAETRAVDDHYMLLAEKLADEDVVGFGNIDAGKGIKRASRGDTADARRRIGPAHRQIAPAAEFRANHLQVILGAVERRGNGILFGMVGAQPGAQQLLNGFPEAPDGRALTAHDTPADAPSWREIVLRKASEGNDRNIRG